MQPPLQRKSQGPHEQQIRPKFATPSGPVTSARPNQRCKENTDSPMQRACQRGHETVVEPLLTVNRYREDFAPKAVPARQGGPIRPLLATRPPYKPCPLVSTWN